MIISNVEGKIWEALRARVATWTETPILYPDGYLSPDSSVAHVIVQDVGIQYGGIKPIDPECGEPIDGILNVSIMVPLNWTFGQHKGFAGRWCDHMRTGFPLTYSDVTVTLRDRPRVLGYTRLDSAWNRLETQTPYRAWG